MTRTAHDQRPAGVEARCSAVRDVDRIVRHTLHELIHHLMDVDRGLGAAG
jgi:hypothetical protein